MRSPTSASALLLAAVATLAVAQAPPIRTEEVHFDKGASSKTIKGTIKGDQIVDYVVRASAGQTMTVSFKPTNASAYFNVTAPGAQESIFVGSSAGNEFKGVLPASGPTTIRVYLMRNAARRNEAASYSLTVSVASAAAAAPAPSATAQIPCAKAAGQPMASCPVSVIRRGGGSATVTVSSRAVASATSTSKTASRPRRTRRTRSPRSGMAT